MLINYLYEIEPDAKVTWRNHDGKEHGIKAKHVPEDIQLVIVPDAGSNDYEEHKKLKDRGIDVLIIDHHETEKESEYAVVVNNQLGDYPNRDLSGTGVVYKVLQAIDNELGVNHSVNYLDLSAIGLIGDMMELVHEENRYYTTQGLNSINNPLIQEVLKEQEYSTKGIVSPMTIAFYCAPLFNAVIRAGEKEEKDQMFEALIDNGETMVYYERGKADEPLTTNTVRMMKRVRQRQNKIVEESVEAIEERIEEKGLLENKVLIVDVSGLLEPNFTGLVANKLLNSNHVKRPVLLLRYDEETGLFSGSGRGYEKGGVKDFRQFLIDSGYFEYARGHANAFGVSIELDNLIAFNDWVNKKYEKVDFGSPIHLVDFIIKGKNLNRGLIEVIDRNHFLWSRGVEEPLIALEEVEVERRNIKVIGKNRNHVKFESNGIEYIKFFVEDDEIRKLVGGKSTMSLSFSLVGRASANEWRGKRTPQILIEDYEFEEEERKFVF